MLSVRRLAQAAFWTSWAPPWGRRSHRARGRVRHDRGHAQELKTQAIALQVGKRLRIFLSDNNAGIDDSLIGAWCPAGSRATLDRPVDFVRVERVVAADGHDYDQIVGALQTMEAWDPADRRPMIVIGTTSRVLARRGERQDPRGGRPGGGLPSHPYGMKMNSEYFVALARTFEAHYGVEFQGSARDR